MSETIDMDVFCEIDTSDPAIQEDEMGYPDIFNLSKKTLEPLTPHATFDEGR